MNYASVKHIISKNLKDEEKILEIFTEIIQDLKNYELEQRIYELESKFSQDMSEKTFNEIKELKNNKKQLNLKKSHRFFCIRYYISPSNFLLWKE